MSIYCKESKIEIANQMLGTFAPNTWIRMESGYVVAEWKRKAETISKRWMCRGQDFYPVWYQQWGHGGTASTALSQLVRWVQGKPVLSACTWRYWAGDKCKLLRHGAWDVALSRMIEAGYPERNTCVLCKKVIDGDVDWWSLNGVSGPCCGVHTWCRQVIPT